MVPPCTIRLAFPLKFFYVSKEKQMESQKNSFRPHAFPLWSETDSPSDQLAVYPVRFLTIFLG